MNSKIMDIERRLQRLETTQRNSLIPSLQLEATKEDKTASVLVEQVAGSQVYAKVIQQYGFWSRPLKDALHMVANVAGAAGWGVSLAANDERYRPLTLKEGDVYVGDNTGQLIWITGGNTINIRTNGTVNITAPTRVLITSPNVEMTGDLLVHGDVTDKNNSHGSVDVLRTNYNTHQHADPQGGLVAVTNKPTS